MILGKITGVIQHIGGHRYFFARPMIAGNDLIHPNTIGVCHVVYLEKNALSNMLVSGNEFTFHGIIDRAHTRDEWLGGFCRIKFSPITEEIYNGLKAIYPQENHIFNV